MVRSNFSFCGEYQMNKYFLLSAAAALASTAAHAGTAVGTFGFGTPSGGSYCDSGAAYTSGSSVWSWQHLNADCYGFTSYGVGLSGKDKAAGKGVTMSDNFFAADYGIASEYVSFHLPKKIKNGATWEVWLGLSGTTAFLANEGPLINVGQNHKSASHKSIAKSLKSLIALHKKA